MSEERTVASEEDRRPKCEENKRKYDNADFWWDQCFPNEKVDDADNAEEDGKCQGSN